MDRLKHNMKRTIFLTTLFSIGVSLNPAFSGEKWKFKIVINSENPTRKIDRKFLSDLFLKKSSQWKDGEPAIPVDLPMESPTRKDFSDEVLDRSVDAVKNYWQQMIFSGRELPPPELKTDQAVIKYVINNKNAVGYVSDGTEVSGAKVLQIGE